MGWLVVLWLCAGVAHAQGFHQTSPGPLSASHGNVTCDDCHRASSPALSNTLCARCHASVVQRGLHTEPAFAAKVCAACHDEHQGPKRDISGWRTQPGGMQGFDHARTKWPLANAHVVACTRCHAGTMASGRTRFTGLSTTCGSCHEANPHRFAGPEFMACDRCHTDAAWKPVKATLDFDHDDTKLPLTGAHGHVACAKCHPASAFAIAKPACASCHASPRHGSPLFDARACEACHTATRFAVVTFDHAARTRFPLEGKHRIACVQCHTPGKGALVPRAECESCHAERPHGARFGRLGCAACHTAVKWTAVSAFRHAEETKFRLVGKHADLRCRACHRGDAATFENFRGQTGCKECHAHATVHADAQHPDGRYTSQQCTQCHVNNMHDEPRSRILLVYHGPQSRFPLAKAHAGVPCSDCHATRTARGRPVFDGLSTECGPTCHVDVAHGGALGPTCSRCHAPGQWEAVGFVHDRYPLVGDHATAACASCHGASKAYRGTPRTCGDAACHARDDVHAGSLGTRCNRCHLPTGENRFDHLISSKYKLDNKHAEVACDGCHPPTVDGRARLYKPRPMTCAGCHPDPAIHKGLHGTFCERCHTTRGWR